MAIFILNMKYNLTPYNEFIAKSRYARFLDEENRREDWNETVDRYFNFMIGHLKNKCNYEIQPKILKQLMEAVKNVEVLPSMRAIMTAGPALERQNVAGFNCAYLPIDDIKSFDELMYILLCGTGVGYSVENRYISKLPEIPDILYDSDTTISVSDSKEGWAKSLRQLLALLYSGEIPKYDLSKIRPAGSRLKTFGGRASGPEPLKELFEFCISKFKNAVGRKLYSLECHDIACKIADVVVVGGVRRSAMISLSDLSDDRLAHAKSGQWWMIENQRQLANNSAVYEFKPDIGQFMREWISLYESKSGERGIFNREASLNQVIKNGRRDENYLFGTNPCSEIILRPYQFCNLSTCIIRSTDSFDQILKKIELATILGTFQSTLTEFPYLRKIWQKNTEEERLLGVSMTGVLDNNHLNNFDIKGLPEKLETLRDMAIKTNKYYAKELDIPQSVAITCIKPEGTTSQLTSTSSGIHPQHSEYYIRNIRADNKDPLTQFMKDKGFINEACISKPDSTTIFSFPIKAPEICITRDKLSSVEHLELWLIYQRHYCEHKPSVTINIKEDDWVKVGAWVYEHFNELTGVSFLPYDGGHYRQSPFIEIDKQEYEQLMDRTPKSIDWTELKEFDDNVEGVQSLSCSAGVCDL